MGHAKKLCDEELSHDDNLQSVKITGHAGNVKVHFEIPEHLLPKFNTASSAFNGKEEKSEHPIDLALSFMEFVSGQKSSGNEELMRYLFESFQRSFIQDVDPHAVFPDHVEDIDMALGRFYKLAASLGKDSISAAHLLEDENLKIMAVFGGQACSEDLLGELEQILTAYGPHVQSLFEKLALTLKECAKKAPEMYLNGFDISAWMKNGRENWPSNDYLLKAPVSLPLIGLIQFLNYASLFKTLNVSPKDLASKFACAAGHSQGVVPAAVISRARNEEEFVAGSVAGLKVLFWIGVHAQLATSAHVLPLEAILDLESGGEGKPSPMLAVNGLARETLEKIIKTVNKNIQDSSQHLEIGLKNGHTIYVVCGPARHLYSLVLALRPLQAKGDQSRVPFPDRKPSFKCQFLSASAPFHSHHLASAVSATLRSLKGEDGMEFFSSPSASLCPTLHGSNGKRVSLIGHQFNIFCRPKVFDGCG